jgi:hypothetical protein
MYLYNLDGSLWNVSQLTTGVSSSGNGHGSSTTTIVLSVILPIVGLSLIGTLIVLLKKRAKFRESEIEMDTKQKNIGQLLDIVVHERLGGGNFGSVSDISTVIYLII